MLQRSRNLPICQRTMDRSTLPTETVNDIANFLPYIEVAKLRLISKKFSTMTNPSFELWNPLLVRFDALVQQLDVAKSRNTKALATDFGVDENASFRPSAVSYGRRTGERCIWIVFLRQYEVIGLGDDRRAEKSGERCMIFDSLISIKILQHATLLCSRIAVHTSNSVN
ncbi:hypothetical protein DdX_14189 [Ditylenchus destructor]|uniref:F-box domain-containing protein n=1 Tax=Ditylenchus destructor TaxID=166010 RepID=A0AAD4MTW6_9BILA|nr:hypothetical protein DdX_14189 [Ditylenchus destructor]